MKQIQQPKTAEYKWEFGTEQIALKVAQYWKGNGLAIQMFNKKGRFFEDFSGLTVNLPGYRLKPGCAFISEFCSKEKLEFIKKHGLGEVLPEKGHSGYGEYAMVAFDLDKLAEFDREGVEEFRRSHGIGVKETQDKKPKEKKRAGQER